MKKLFGTDGIRGIANQTPMTIDIATKVGQALGTILLKSSLEKKTGFVLIGKDTRLSGYMLEMALASGLNSMGVHVQLVGPLPTPGIGYLAQNMRADAGIVISASHNSYEYNGIKIFDSKGFKITAKIESEIENLVFNGHLTLSNSENIGRTRRIVDSAGRYIVFVKNSFPLNQSLVGIRVVLDTANGAAYKVGSAVFEELGAEVIKIGREPNGRNINHKCGALYPEAMASTVKEHSADVGISLDGDADRVIMADENGSILRGDHILAICAIHLKEQGELKKDTIVTTEMSNLGLDLAMKKHRINVIKTDVGDRHVIEEMKSGGYSLGGESSGHIIFLDKTTTGDGLVAALNVLRVMKEKNKKLSEVTSDFNDVPQIVKNISVSKKIPLEQIPGFHQKTLKIKKLLEGKGRLFIRYSGTEPLMRIMIEGSDSKVITEYADELVRHIQSEIG